MVAFIQQWMDNLGPTDSVLFCMKPVASYMDSNMTFETFIDGSNFHRTEDSYSIEHAKEQIFSNADIAYMRGQAIRYQQYDWKPEDFPNRKFISDQKIGDIFGKAGPDGWRWFRQRHLRGFHSMSLPLFSRKGDRAFFYEEFGCGGLCGAGASAFISWCQANGNE